MPTVVQKWVPKPQTGVVQIIEEQYPPTLLSNIFLKSDKNVDRLWFVG